MNKSKRNKILLALLLVASLLSTLPLSPVSMIKAEAKTKLSVTVKLGSKKVNKKTVRNYQNI